MHSSTNGRSLVAAGTKTYDAADFDDLDQVPNALELVLTALDEVGAGQQGAPCATYHLNPTRDQLRSLLEHSVVAADVVIVYYIGHGTKPEGDDYYILTSDSKPPFAQNESAMTPLQLVKQLTRWGPRGGVAGKQPNVLLIVDACYSGNAGLDVLTSALRGIGNPNVWVVASASPVEWASQGVFASGLAQALRNPTTGASQPYLSLDVVVQEINNYAQSMGHLQVARWFVPAGGSAGIPPFLPNRQYRPNLAGLTVSEQHWLSKAQGSSETDMTGYYLTGRTGRITAVEDLGRWIAHPRRSSLAFVTGIPGSGKSALLALHVLLGRPHSRRNLLENAPPGSIADRAARNMPPETEIIAVHARGLNSDQVGQAIAAGLSRNADTAASLLQALTHSTIIGNPLIIVDAVDESTVPSALLDDLLVPLAKQHNVRVLVGARRNVLPVPEAEDLVIDLDSGRYRDPEALAEYALQLLLALHEPGVATPYQERQTVASVAAAIAEQATNQRDGAESFLIARVLALTVRARQEPVDVTAPNWVRQIPSSLAMAFAEDISRLNLDPVKAKALLCALAWARGPGLPWETVWAPMALAVSEGLPLGPLTIREADIRRLLEQAGAYIVEDLGPGGRSVFRPFHHQLAEYLLGLTASDSEDRRTQERIVERLLAFAPKAPSGQVQWDQAHPYILTYLAEHAAAAGIETLNLLVRDFAFLATADAATLTPLLSQFKLLDQDLVRIYRRARPLFGDDARLNASYLEEAATIVIKTAPTGWVIEPAYRTVAALARADTSTLTLSGHAFPVSAVGFGTDVAGERILASGSFNGEVLLWNPDTGQPRGRLLVGQQGGLRAMVLGANSGGEPLIAASGFDGRMSLWNPETGQLLGQPTLGQRRGVWALAFGVDSESRPILATGSLDGKVQLWNPDNQQLLKEFEAYHFEGVIAVAFAPDSTNRYLIATLGSRHTTVRLWNPDTGQPHGRPIKADFIKAMAFGPEPGGGSMLVTAGNWLIQRWNPGTGQPHGKLRAGGTDYVMAVAVGMTSEGRSMLATAGDRDGTVRLRLLGAEKSQSVPLIGHTRRVNTLAFGSDAAGNALLATGSFDGTVRLWSPESTSRPTATTGDTGNVSSVALGNDSSGQPLLALGKSDGRLRLWSPVARRSMEVATGHAGRVRTIAFATGVGQRPLVATGGLDGSVRIWDAESGGEIGNLFTEHSGGVRVVAFGIDSTGGPLMATGGGDDATVRIWNPISQRPFRGPVRAYPFVKRFMTWLVDHAEISALAFDVDSNARPILAVGTYQGAISLYNLGERRNAVKRLVTRQSDGVSRVAFSTAANCRRLLATAANWDEHVSLWDPETGELQRRWRSGHDRGINAVAFGNDVSGKSLLITAGYDATVRVWSPDTGACLAILRRRITPNLVAVHRSSIVIVDDEALTLITMNVRALTGLA